jgi:hypothetical protein
VGVEVTGLLVPVFTRRGSLVPRRST